ncbi:MAG: SAM-dependent methyltransferase [Lachnospiraceae bacterium]|nr:SAM-dependent methyltransferase [Lachnospiraceae bacterium]
MISKRLQMLVDMVTPGMRVVDVGCDHGFVAIQLVRNHISPSVIAMDVRKGPLTGAREHVEEYGLADYIETRLSDGLCEYHSGEADAMVCAGMGGPLMMRILTEGAEKVASMKELILQPQSELQEFRRFLRTNGYQTLEEHILLEEEKFYFLFRVVLRSASEADIKEDENCILYDKFGKLLLQKKDPMLKRYLEKNLKTVEQIIAGLAGKASLKGQQRMAELLGEKEDLQRALIFLEADYHVAQ